MKDDKKSKYGKFDVRKPEGMWRKVFSSTHAWEPILDRAEGIYLYDTDGNRFIDASGGPMAINMPHGDKRVNAAVSEQMEKFAYAHPSLSNLRKAELCEKLSQVTPGDLNTTYLSAGGGSDAIEAALKLARQYHMATGNSEKHLFVSHYDSYHGMSLGALALSGGSWKQHFDPLLIKWPNTHQYSDHSCPAGMDREEYGVRAAQELEELVYWHGADRIAAFVATPWGTGIEYGLMPPKSYWKTIREICDTYNILLIADEVVTGFGRTGKWFCMEHYDVQADMMIIGKGITSVYAPLGGVCISDRVNEPFEKGTSFIHGFTNQGHPIACAAALAVLDILEKDGLVENSAAMGEYLYSQKDRLLTHPTVAEVQGGRGLFMKMELVANKETMDFFPGESEAETHFQAIGLENGVVFYSTLYGPRVPSMPKRGLPILMAPPLCIIKAQVDELLDAVDATLTRWEERMGV